LTELRREASDARNFRKRKGEVVSPMGAVGDSLELDSPEEREESPAEEAHRIQHATESNAIDAELTHLQGKHDAAEEDTASLEKAMHDSILGIRSHIW